MDHVTGYDFVGDIHGHADELHALLGYMGYQQSDGVFEHSERKVVFLGDFIDRGPKIREVIETVRPMIETGNALAVMGNHEFNALAFHTSTNGRQTNSLRPRTVKNIRQHAATLQQLSDSQLVDALEWFRTLPMWAEVALPQGGQGRAVHACWDEFRMQQITEAQNRFLGVNADFMAAATRKGSDLFEAVEIVLKGKELGLPKGCGFRDKEGHERTEIRAKWYERPAPGTLYQHYALQADPINCPIELDESTLAMIEPYHQEAPPVFVGHYWLKAERPEPLASNVACVDYSVAKGGYLCAYRWDGEAIIDNSKFSWHPSNVK